MKDGAVQSAPAGCPVKHDGISASISTTQNPSVWGYLFASSAAKNNLEGYPIVTNAQKDSREPPCPMKEHRGGLLPASLEEAARHAQTPQADQRFPLDTARQVSSIPRITSEGTLPAHQHLESAEKWVYPSEQQLYNAMRKKGWSNIPEDSIPTVLQIHNNINERTWRQIQRWEGTETLNLARFQGRPRDITPKAFLYTHLLRLYDPPFDRHDWYVEQPSGYQQRYVIDYYYLPPEHPDMPPTPFIDARPALDHPRAVMLHGRRFLQNAFPGITTYLQQRADAAREQ